MFFKNTYYAVRNNVLNKTHKSVDRGGKQQHHKRLMFSWESDFMFAADDAVCLTNWNSRAHTAYLLIIKT